MAQLLSLRYVAVGGIIGTVIRWITILNFSDRREDEAILALNVMSSILLGVLLGRKKPRNGRVRVTKNWELLLGTGFCGGLTTFSTYAVEVAIALDTGRIADAALAGTTTVLAAVIGAGIGYRIGARW